MTFNPADITAVSTTLTSINKKPSSLSTNQKSKDNTIENDFFDYTTLDYSSELFDLDSLPLLLPDESYSVVFSITKIIGGSNKCVGLPVFKWCTYMGEHGIVRGADVVIASNTSSQDSRQVSGGNYIKHNTADVIVN